ncbi:thioredoxin domain-containing protein [Taibaiella koreensis]|uniref:thioredoxin domain-containing protein n=1 Tax=Taibaiella koreensis TaxID=1268548 RepID=UPI000E59AF4D|nr:thioredoxin domain-containing protein [Taibaiella koreensis]
MSNRLQYESSPYLQQHANNPVDWYPWGDEAFERAAREHKPVLVSIGYSACHWCHVMEHESFEDPGVAAFMNEHFVNIKVDREEHPDVDHLYMDALQAMTGSGGWPLNMFVTPDRKPFYGGTYFPPEQRYGRSSWRQLLEALRQAWLEKPEEIRLQSEQMLQHLRQASQVAAATGAEEELSLALVDTIADNLLQQADKEDGGFGPAPKFPATGSIRYLLEYWHYHRERQPERAAAALEQALLSLDKMIAGGIYDQVGGGFARYATDREWLVPHFEKMLYDNALLVILLCDAYRLTGNPVYGEVIRETIAFCYRELGFADTGGFWCALDADSEGEEGKFYTWTIEEWQAITPGIHPAVAQYFGVTEAGNWEGTNILNQAVPATVVMETFSLTPDEWHVLLQQAKEVLYASRSCRERPGTDDKQLLSWNALMNIALVEASLALDDAGYLDDAGKHMAWMLKHFKREDSSLAHVFKDGIARIAGKLDDYAYLVKALCRLATVDGATQWLQEAEELMRYTDRYFLQEDNRFYYFSSSVQSDILVRKTELYDDATPSANAVMMENLWLMGNLYENGGWTARSEAMLYAMKQTVMRYPGSFARWAVFLQQYQVGLMQLVIAGPAAQQALIAWNKAYVPEVAAVAVAEDYASLPAAKGKFKPGFDYYYLCSGMSCLPPVTTQEAVIALLEKRRTGGR